MNDKKTRLMMSSASLWGASIIGAIVCGLLYQAETKAFMTFIVLAVIFNLVFVCYLRILKEKLLEKPLRWMLLSVAYFLSFVLLCNPYEISDYPLWLFGIACVAIYGDVTLSLIMMYSLLFISTGVGVVSLEQLMLPMIIGTFLCLMVRFLKGFSSLFYLCILLLTMNVTISFVMNGFDEKKVGLLDNPQILGSYLLVVLLLFFVVKLVPTSRVTNQEVSNEDVIGHELQGKEEIAVAKEPVNEQLEKELASAVSDQAPLMMELKKESDKLYHHSKLIGTISQRAANRIGANEAIACAGGWYHEIGRLRSKDYIPSGVDLIHENQLPEVIADIIKQHNYKVERPKTREAAIVMLTDNIVSTITYLKNNKDVKISSDKVVENTFIVLMNKKTLDEAGFDIATLMKLKEFYLTMVEELIED